MSNIIQNRICDINWFCNIGNKDIPENISICFEYVKNEKEFIKNVTSTRWENVIIDNRNDLTDIVEETDPDNIDKWNDVVSEFKQNKGNEIRQKIEEKLDAYDKKTFITDVVIFGLIFVIVADYFEVLHKSQFFENYFSILESGHIPCGYKKGKFLIY